MGSADPNNLVLISSSRPERVDPLKQWLETAGLRGVRVESSLASALEETRPRVAVVDGGDAPTRAVAACQAIRSAAPDVVLLLIVPPGDYETVERALELGVTHFAEEPFTARVLAMRIRALAFGGSARGRARSAQAAGGAHQRRRAIEAQLRPALDRGEFEVHYQPRVDLSNDVISGAEALLRWRSAELGDVAPKEFIPIAEDCGLIVPIGEWVLETACRQLARWRQNQWRDLRISVNVSSVQFAASDVLRTVTDVLRTSDLQPHQLELEVTERLMLAGDERTALSLRDLRAIGITVSLDDFGTGYSSLSTITHHPIDVLKIDRSIAAAVEEDPASASIVSAVVSLCRSLGLGVVAEGVDALGQARLLGQLGCDELQGFLVSPAVPARRFEEIARNWEGIERCKDPGDP